MSSLTGKKKSVPKDSLMQMFFENEIAALYGSEKYLKDYLQILRNLCFSPSLMKAFDIISEEVTRHQERLEKIFGLMGLRPSARLSDTLTGFSDTNDLLIRESLPKSFGRDLALILIFQKIALYKISTYSGLSQIATVIGLPDIAHILEISLEEEKNSDQWLSALQTDWQKKRLVT